MDTKVKFITGVVFAVLAIGGWVTAKSFTGNEIGGTCNGDGDCMGMEAVCMIGGSNEKYCTIPCADHIACPDGWTCETVGVTNISGTGEMSSGGTTQLCIR